MVSFFLIVLTLLFIWKVSTRPKGFPPGWLENFQFILHAFQLSFKAKIKNLWPILAGAAKVNNRSK